MTDPLDGAFAWKRASSDQPTPGPATPTAPSADPNAKPVAGSGDDVSASQRAQGLAILLLVLGIVITVVWDADKTAFKAGEGFVLFTGFYVAAQAIERLLELLPVGFGTKQAKANRAVVFPGIGFILAIVAAEWLGLYYLQAVGVTTNENLDIIVTALAIGGGTKPLHDAIKRIEKSKETPQATH